MTPEQKKEAEDQALLIEAIGQQEQAEAEPQAGEWIPPEQDAANDAVMNTADLIQPLLSITFGLMSKIKGAHWALPDDVAAEAAAEYGKCLDHYYPNMTAAPWVGAVMVSGMILAPRIMEDKAIEAAQAEAEANGEATETGAESGD